ncbi:MAG: hypothetical protein OM95_05380 [Bdellovibrio sp. ArHS]|nr:MAG: hypothetical protein OM95_05380 [Bdellovibrio sp. ArHS]
MHILLLILICGTFGLFVRTLLQHPVSIFSDVLIFLLSLFVWLGVLNLSRLARKIQIKKIAWIFLVLQAFTLYSAYQTSQSIWFFGLIANLSLNLLAGFVFMANEKKTGAIAVLASTAFFITLVTKPLQYWLTGG